MLPQLGGDVRLRAAAPDLALARIQLDEQGREQLTSAERVGLVPRVEKAGESHPRCRRWRINLGLLCEQPLALLPVFVGRDVAPLEALTHASQLRVDAFPRSAGPIGRGISGGDESFGDSLALVVATLKEGHQLAAPGEQRLLADAVADVVTVAAATVVDQAPDLAPHDDLVFALMLGLFVKTGLPESCRVFTPV